MRRHSIIGERILAASPALAPVGPLVHATHERLDGHGYPDCLHGDQIPLPAQIVAAVPAIAQRTKVSAAVSRMRRFLRARGRPA